MGHCHSPSDLSNHPRVNNCPVQIDVVRLHECDSHEGAKTDG